MENKDTDVVAKEYKGYPIAKTVTICGPRKFQHIMEAVKEELEKNFITVHMPNFSFTKEEIAQFTPEQFKKLHDQHYRKMDQSDYVYIVNAGGSGTLSPGSRKCSPPSAGVSPATTPCSSSWTSRNAVSRPWRCSPAGPN